MSRRHAWQALPFAAVADPDPRRRGLLAAELGCPGFPSCDAMLEAVRPGAVVIASPPWAHEADARACSLAGVPALVEKPPAGDLEGARRIAGLGLPPAIGFNRRFAQGAKLLERIPAEGRLELELGLSYRRSSWAPREVRDPALLDLAPHLLDLALLFDRSRPLSVRASSSRPERVEIALRSERGTAAISCASDAVHREFAVARGEGIDGELRWSIGGFARGMLARLRPGPHPLAASLAAQLEAFAEHLAGGDRGLLAGAGDGVRVMELVGAAERSIESGAEVEPAPSLSAVAGAPA